MEETLERVDFYPRLYIPSAKFAMKSDEDWEKLETKAPKTFDGRDNKPSNEGRIGQH